VIQNLVPDLPKRKNAPGSSLGHGQTCVGVISVNLDSNTPLV
jgi:hypothetical protein